MKLFKDKTKPAPAPSQDPSRAALADVATEVWRLTQAVDKVLMRMDPMAAERFAGQYRWFQKKVSASMNQAGLQTVDLTGQPYSIGMAATALNADDFDDDDLIVVQTVEPVVMAEGKVLKTGTVLLGLRDEYQL